MKDEISRTYELISTQNMNFKIHELNLNKSKLAQITFSNET